MDVNGRIMEMHTKEGRPSWKHTHRRFISKDEDTLQKLCVHAMSIRQCKYHPHITGMKGN